MDVREIVSEAPVSGIKQAAQSVGSAVSGKIPGMKNVAANLGGKADLSKVANDYYTQFNRYLGTQGKTIKQATGDDLAAFFQSKEIMSALWLHIEITEEFVLALGTPLIFDVGVFLAVIGVVLSFMFSIHKA